MTLADLLDLTAWPAKRGRRVQTRDRAIEDGFEPLGLVDAEGEQRVDDRRRQPGGHRAPTGPWARPRG